jgi:hypothetical protein
MTGAVLEKIGARRFHRRAGRYRNKTTLNISLLQIAQQDESTGTSIEDY